MIMLKKPLQLKSLFDVTDISFAFAEKIQANYIFMTATMPKEELVHLLTEEADRQGNTPSVTMLVENFTAVNQNEIMIKLLNQVINRILAAGENRITYQDNVYITCILNKLGITDIKTFIRRVKNSREELFLKNQLLETYEKEKALLKTFYQSSMHSTEKTGKAVYQELEKKEENYLYEKVITRLHTAEIYQTVSEFNYTQGMGQKYFFHRELELSEQRENMLNIRLMQAKKELVNPNFQIELFHTNLYEEELPQGDLNVKENVLTGILRAAVFSLSKSFSLAELFRRNHLGNQRKRWLHNLGNQHRRWLHDLQKKNDWYEAGFEICNTAKNTINRCQWYYQRQLELSSNDIQIFSEQRNRLYRYELEVLQKITEAEKQSKNSSFLLKYKRTDSVEEENYLQKENFLLTQNEGSYRTDTTLSELKENELKTENVFLESKEKELKIEEALQKTKDEKDDSLQTEEILLRLKEIMGKDSAKTAQSFKQPYEEEHFQKDISVQEVRSENQKNIVHEKSELENTAVDFYHEIQSLAMVQNYVSKFFSNMREETGEINTKSSSDFRESVEKMNRWIEESFYKNSENKSLSYRVFQDMEKRKDTIMEHYHRAVHSKEISKETDRENTKQIERQRIQRKMMQHKELQREAMQQKEIQRENLQQRKMQENNIREKQLQKEFATKKYELQKEMLNEKDTHRKEIEEENRHKRELWKENAKEKELQKDILQKKEAEQIFHELTLQTRQISIKNEDIENTRALVKREYQDMSEELLFVDRKEEPTAIYEVSVSDKNGQKKAVRKEDIDNIRQYAAKKETPVLDKSVQKELENQEKNKKEILQIFREIESENIHNAEQTAIEHLQESQIKYLTSSETSKKTLSTLSTILEVSQKETGIQKNNTEIIKQQENQRKIQTETIQKKTGKNEFQNETIQQQEEKQSEVQSEIIYHKETEQSEFQSRVIEQQEENQSEIIYYKEAKQSEFQGGAIGQQEEKQSEVQGKIIYHKKAEQNEFQGGIIGQQEENQSEIIYHKEVEQSEFQGGVIKQQEEKPQQIRQIFNELEQNQTIYNQSEQIVQSIESDYMNISEQYSTYEPHIIQNLSNKPFDSEQIDSAFYINQEGQSTLKEQVKENSQKESIQHIFQELETETIQGTAQESIRKISKANGYSNNKKAEIVYRRRQQNILETDSEQRINDATNACVDCPHKTEQKTEKTVYHNRVNLPEIVHTSIQNKTKTETKQINEIKQFVQSSIQKQINQITDQVYKKIEKKLQNERRRRGL